MRQAQLGKKQSQKTIQKKTKTRMERGYKHSNETIQKIRETKIGEKNPMFGKKHSLETKQKLQEKAIERYKQKELLNG